MKIDIRRLLSFMIVASAVTMVAAAPIRLKSGEVDTSLRIANSAVASLYAAENCVRVYLVQCAGSICPEWRESIEQCGGKILGYVPDDAYLVAADGTTAADIACNVKYAYFGDYRPEHKVSTAMKDVMVQATRLKADSNDEAFRTSAYAGDFVLSVFPFAKASDVAEKISMLDGCIVVEAEGDIVRAKLSESAVSSILSWPEVEWLEPHVEKELFNNVAVEQPRMNVKTVWPSGASGLGLTGHGQVVAVCDTGLDTGNTSSLHEDVRGRVTRTYCYGRSNSWSDPDGHGTHVVGSVLGNGTKSSGSIKGVAYEASLIMQSTLNSSGGLSMPSDLKTLFQTAYNTESGKVGARIHSNSWGAGRPNGTWILGYYGSDSRAIDQFCFEHPDMLLIFAAGNDGMDSNADGVIDGDSLSTQASAKNSITVGAAESYRTSGGYSVYTWASGSWASKFLGNVFKTDGISYPYDGSHQGMAAFSSRGPCDDGRIKPDIVAPGTDIVSLHSSLGDWGWGQYNSYYAYMGGTSMATPLTAGAAVLVRQWLVENQNIANPDGATVKAVMLAGAKSLTPGQYGTGATREIPNSYPNNVEGWGQVNLGNALANSSGVAVFDGKVIEHGKTQEYKVSVSSAGSPLAIVMAYMDAPASLTSSAQLVNDLDLTVTTPSGSTVYPNSRTSADRVNNVEGVRISSAQKGVYTIKVKAHSISSPMASSLTGGKANATRYSVAVSGATQSAALEVSDCFLSNQSKSLGSATPVTAFQKGENIYVYCRIHNPRVVDFRDDFLVKNELLRGNVTKGSLETVYSETIEANGNYDIAAYAWNGLKNLSVGSYTYRLTMTASGADPVVRTVEFTVEESPSPLALVEVIGASTVGGGSKSVYTCRATLEDGTVVTATPVWSIDYDGRYFANIAQDGTLEAYATEYRRSVVVRASCEYNGVTRSGTMAVAINPVLTLPVALDCQTWTITGGGDAEWFGQIDDTYDGADAAQSGAITHGQTSWFEVTVQGSGTLSFWYRVSTELNYDKLVVSSGGIDWFTSSGQGVWTQHSIVLDGPGSHVVRFAYVKDVSLSQGEDAVYVDQLAWTTLPTPESLTITGDGSVAAGSTLQLGCTALMSDGSERVVTSDCTWSVLSGSSYATVSETGLLTTVPSTVDRSVVVRVSYTAADVTKTATHTIVITGVEPLPSAPVITRSGAGDYSAAVLGWTAADNAASYRIYRSSGASRPSEPLAILGNVLAYRDDNVEPGVEYRYWASAVNTSGEAVSGGAIAYRDVQLTVAELALSFAADGGTTNLAIKSNASVSCTSAEDWLSVSCFASSLTVEVSSNESEESRMAVVTLTAAGATAHPSELAVTVFQAGRIPEEQGLPDLTFATFDQGWDVDYAMYAAETADGDKACRLFNLGDDVHLRYGWGNFGDGIAAGTVTNVIEIGRRKGNVEIDSVDERDIDIDVLTTDEMVVELGLDPGCAQANMLAADSWRSLSPGVYIAKVFLNLSGSLEESDYYNNALGFRFAVRNPITLQSALDCESSSLEVSTVSDQWYGTADIGYDGEDCAMTRLAGDGSSATLKATVSGAGTLSFVYKVATEASYDVLTLKDGNTVLMADSGIGEWRQVSFDIAAGDHVFTWTYAKDAIGSDGDDCVYLDGLVWTPVRSGEPPVDFTASTDKSTYVLLTWTAVNEAKSYIIERTTHGDDDWCQIYAGTAVRAYDRETMGGVVYDYRIKTVYPDGESDWSDVVSGYRTAYVTSPTYRWIPAATGSDGFSFSPTGRWTATSDSDWLMIETASGEGACKFVYRYEANAGDKQRTAKITLTVGETENGSKSQGYWAEKTITVYQNAAVVTGGTLPLSEAANTTLHLVTSQDYPWIGQRRISHDGVASIRSGEIGQNATSRVEAVVATGGTLTFWWGSSSGTQDKLTFYINGVKQESISGYTNTQAGRTNCTNWAEMEVTIPDSGAVIAWEYVRSTLSGYAEDAAFVDQITWVPALREVFPEDAWFEKYYPDLFERLGVSWEDRMSILAMASPGTFADGKSLGKWYADGTSMKVLDDYVAGTNPLDSDSKFRACIEIVDGAPRISWMPVLEASEAALRNYLIYGRESLSDGEWSPVADGHESDYKFFKVTVEMQ